MVWSVAPLGLEFNLFLEGLFKSFWASSSLESLLDLARLGAPGLESEIGRSKLDGKLS